LSGNDQDTSVGPNEAVPIFGARDRAFVASQVKIPVPEVYDPKTDTTVALENARMVVADSYPYATVVQTGPGKNDWKACMVDGQLAPAAEATVPRTDATDDAAEWRLYCDVPGCANDTRAIAAHNLEEIPSSLACLDVQAALADPSRNIPANNHWTHIDTYPYYAGRGEASYIVKIGPKGKTLSQKLFKTSTTVGGGRDIYTIDFSDPNPQIQVLKDVLYQGHLN
jgi:hypothetical protein